MHYFPYSCNVIYSLCEPFNIRHSLFTYSFPSFDSISISISFSFLVCMAERLHFYFSTFVSDSQ